MARWNADFSSSPAHTRQKSQCDFFSPDINISHCRINGVFFYPKNLLQQNYSIMLIWRYLLLLNKFGQSGFVIWSLFYYFQLLNPKGKREFIIHVETLHNKDCQTSTGIACKVWCGIGKGHVQAKIQDNILSAKEPKQLVLFTPLSAMYETFVLWQK